MCVRVGGGCGVGLEGSCTVDRGEGTGTNRSCSNLPLPLDLKNTHKNLRINWKERHLDNYIHKQVGVVPEVTWGMWAWSRPHLLHALVKSRYLTVCALWAWLQPRPHIVACSYSPTHTLQHVVNACVLDGREIQAGI